MNRLERFPNLVSMFLTRATEKGDTPFLWAKRNGTWVSTSWSEAARQVAALAEQLSMLGLDPVLLVSENRPEWLIADLAIMTAGLVTVPAYTTNTERDHAHILANCGARAAIVSNSKLAAPLLAAAMDGSACREIIAIERLELDQALPGFRVHQWEQLVADGGNVTAFAERAAAFRREDLACIIYTSGTGGAPRGVRQHHGAILHNCEGCTAILAQDFGWGEEMFLSFLPASHAFEHSAGQHFPIALGAQISFAESLEKLAANIEEVRPTVMVVVPRLFELLRARTLKTIAASGRVANWLLTRALANATRRHRGRPSLLDWPTERLLDLTLRRKVRARFGGRIKALVSGGAPLNTEVGLFFEAMGLTLLQGYGQTEAGPVVTCNRPSAGMRIDSVGSPLINTEVRVAEDGELMIRGENVMHAYWDNPDETAKVLVDGWLMSGDVGHFDDRGRIVITDRKKDLIVNDKGENVSPQRIEGLLTLQPEIAQAMVHGDKRPYLVALLVPDKEHDRDRQAIAAAVDRVNASLSVTERVRRFTIAEEPFSVANQQLTPSLKIRRHAIRERYGATLDQLYRS